MLKTIVRTAIAALLTALALPPAGALALGLTRGPYVENPTQDSALIRWRTEISTVTWLEYGPQPYCAKTMTISASGKEHAIKLFDLLPATTYCYRLTVPYNDGANSVLAATGTFSTFRQPEQTNVEFMLFGNTGSSEPVEGQLASAMLAPNPDFAMHTGNLFPSGKDEDADEYYFSPHSGLLAKMPVFITPGPNEYGNIATAWSGKNFFRQNYKRWHQMSWGPGSPSYYSFKTANVLFVVLDTNFIAGTAAAPEISSGSAQMTWLKNTLTRGTHRWKFVFTHTPLYSSGGPGPYPSLTTELATIFEKYKVNAVFQGGENCYERLLLMKDNAPSETDGVLYITSGAAGRLSEHTPEAGAWTAKLDAVPNFVTVTVSYNSAIIKAYGADGLLLDEYTLTR